MKTFIHIGVPKAGSTYLQKYLRLRSEIYHNWMDMADFPLYNSIDKDIARKGLNKSIRVFSQESLSTPLICLDRIRLTPHIEKIKDVRRDTAVKLKEMFPDAEVLLVLRSYEDIVPSIYSELLVMGSTLNKTEFLKKFGKFLLELYDYEQIIQLYAEIFGKEKLTVIPFEILRDDADKFQEFLANYLKVDHYKVIIGMENKGISDRITRRVRSRNILRFLIVFLLPVKYRFNFSEYWRSKNIRLKNKKWSVRNAAPIDFNGISGFDELIADFKSRNTLVSTIESFKKYAEDY